MLYSRRKVQATVAYLMQECDDPPPNDHTLRVVTTCIGNVTPQDISYSDSTLDTATAKKCDTDHSPLHRVTMAFGETASRPVLALFADSDSSNTRNTRQLEPALPVVTTDISGYVTISRIDSSDTGTNSSSNKPPTLSTIEPLHVVTDDHSLAPPELTLISIVH